jgi:hypothetical protein
MTRMEIQRKAQTSYLFSIIVVQWADVIICKTRVLSVFQHGMVRPFRLRSPSAPFLLHSPSGGLYRTAPTLHHALRTAPRAARG